MKSKLLIAFFACCLICSKLSAQCYVAFNYQQAPNSYTITVNVDSTSDTGNGLSGTPSYSWTFGDNTGTIVDSGTSLSHNYINPGTYVVCVTMTDALTGCNVTSCDSVTVQGSGGGCGASISYTRQDSLYTFTAIASGQASYVYNWSNSNGTLSGSSSSVSEVMPDQYVNVCVTVTDDTGCIATSCVGIVDSTNGTTCSASISYTNQDSVYTFAATTSGQAPYTYSWSNSNTNTTGSSADFITPLSIGNNIICVTVTDNTGCVAVACISIEDTALHSTSGGCSASIYYNNQDSLYNFSATASGQAPYTYSWSDNNGNIISVSSSFSSILPDGYNQMCVTVTDDTGCVALTCTGFYDSAQANTGCGTAYIGYTNQDSLYTFTASYIGNSAAAYQWVYGNSVINSNTSFSVVLDSAQLASGYTLCLDITDASGCVSSNCTTVYGTAGGGSCHAYFAIYADTVNNGTGSYVGYNYSTGSYGSNILWNFGDGTTSTDPYPSHTYAQPGIYIICLTVGVGGTSCYDTYCDSSFYVSRALIDMSSITILAPAGINTISSVTALGIYPNPVSSELNITTPAKIDQERITNVEGQVVYESKYGSTRIDVSALSTGIYILELTSQGLVSRIKFVKE